MIIATTHNMYTVYWHFISLSSWALSHYIMSYIQSTDSHKLTNCITKLPDENLQLFFHGMYARIAYNLYCPDINKAFIFLSKGGNFFSYTGNELSLWKRPLVICLVVCFIQLLMYYSLLLHHIMKYLHVLIHLFNPKYHSSNNVAL
jgi:hypothetical protein